MGSTTGRALKKELGIKGGRELDSAKGYDTLIRWGCSVAPDLDTEFNHVINNAAQIARVSNRQHMFADFRRLFGNDPNYDKLLRYTHGFDVPSDWERGALIRSKFSRWGSDIIKYDPTKDYDEPAFTGCFCVEYWPGDYEIRVHIMDNRCICMQIKKQREGVATVSPPPDITVRNNVNGWALHPLTNDEAREKGINKRVLRDFAKLVVTGMNLSFGVADFIVRCSPPARTGESRNFSYKLLEVNTAPGLEGYTFEKYVTAFRALLELQRPEEEEIPAGPAPAPAVTATVSGVPPRLVRTPLLDLWGSLGSRYPGESTGR